MRRLALCCPPVTHSYDPAIALRFRGYLPVVIDVETAGFDAGRDALLEIAAIALRLDGAGRLVLAETAHAHIEPFPGANLDRRALAFTGIDPYHPFRMAVPERKGLEGVFAIVRRAVKASACRRAILVGHNAGFDLAFLNAAVARASVKRNPFHPFSTLDTVSLSALAYGHTVLARAVQLAGLDWDEREAHSALYDAERTAQLFCTIVNRWQECCPDRPWQAPLDYSDAAD
jgi:ribonuclease T